MSATLSKWTRPSDYIGATWYGWYVFLSRNRDSGCLENSNFETGLAAVKAVMSQESVAGEDDDYASVQVVSENHWAVGWVEWIAIHETDTAALAEANRIMERLENYPVLDEDDLSRREMDEANEVWRNCYRWHERIAYIREHRSQFEFHDLRDMLGCVRGQYFAGYASELIH